MNDPVWIRVGALYFPLVLALLAGLLRGSQPRQFAACLLSLLWAVPGLLIVQQLNGLAGWWRFSAGGVDFCGMPLELYLGWVVLWGILPQLAFRRMPIALCAGVLIAADLILMPACRPLVQLSLKWLLGEAVAAIVVLVPALCIGRWTLEVSHLGVRAAMQVAIAGMVFLYFVPELAFTLRPGLGWIPLLNLPGWEKQLALQLIFVLAVPGVGAVAEFAESGMGTPIPYDPPKRLVISGVYRYCANPMQVSCALVMVVWAVLLRNGWLLLAAGVSIIYSAGLAEWDEKDDLSRRFGDDWTAYRAVVKSWRPRWRPYHAGLNARLYISATCGPCSELRAWLEARRPAGMEMLDAESLPAGSILRLRYDPSDGSPIVDGVRALGRALEHLHLGWAMCGAALRLPLVWQSVQLVMDASGFGPRILPEPAAVIPERDGCIAAPPKRGLRRVFRRLAG